MDNFPKTKTSCKLKWAWSTLYLNHGRSYSCHRTGCDDLTPDNFNNFHNLPTKIRDRENMLAGKWPETSCSYCKNIEESNGTSDRVRQWTVPYTAPKELIEDKSATHITPTHLEVYFSNKCNMGCLYCHSTFSSLIDSENKEHGDFIQGGVELVRSREQYQNFVPLFWDWFDENYQNLSRLQVLGGEPFFQEDFDKLLDKLEQNPNPNCEFNVVTNLKVPRAKLEKIVSRFKSLLANRCLKRIDISCSIDCWGPEQEFIRYGMDLKKWESNFKYLLEQKWLTLHVQQTITPLSIKSTPEFMRKLSEWRQQHKIGQWFSGVAPGPAYLTLSVLGGEIFEEDFKQILDLMPEDTDEDRMAKKYMEGISLETHRTGPQADQIRDLFVYLDEKDRRRGTEWRSMFPWLVDFEKYL